MGKHFLFFLEDIDILGIDYLRHNMPSDNRTFPMIARKRKLTLFIQSCLSNMSRVVLGCANLDIKLSSLSLSFVNKLQLFSFFSNNLTVSLLQ